MAVPKITASNVAALLAAFRAANAPEPAERPTPAEPVPRPREPTAPGADVWRDRSAPALPTSARPAMTRALFEALQPQPPSLRRGIEAYAAALPSRTIELDALLALARTTLDRAQARQGAVAGEELADDPVAALDRRALFAVAGGLGGLFTRAEREGARDRLFQLAAHILARLEAAATPAERLGVLASLIEHFDAAGPEERATSEWLVQRAAAALGRDRAATDAGLPRPADPEVGNLGLAAVRAAIEEPALISGQLAGGLPPSAATPEAPLLGTALLSPEMLLAGLAAALRTIDRRLSPAPRRAPSGQIRPDAPDAPPAPEDEEAGPTQDFDPAEDDEGSDWEEQDDDDGDDEEFDPAVDR